MVIVEVRPLLELIQMRLTPIGVIMQINSGGPSLVGAIRSNVLSGAFLPHEHFDLRCGLMLKDRHEL